MGHFEAKRDCGTYCLMLRTFLHSEERRCQVDMLMWRVLEQSRWTLAISVKGNNRVKWSGLRLTVEKA